MNMRWYDPLADTVLDEPGTAEWLIPLFEHREVRENTSLVAGTQLQFAWDSTSLAAFKKCPRYYRWTVLDGHQLSPMAPALHYGIAQHTVFETWHRLLALGIEREVALARCVRLAGLLGEYIVPTDNIRTKETLVRTTVWYIDQFWDDPAQTIILNNGKPATEYSFTIPLLEIDGIEFFLSGHMDRVARFLDDLYITDYKTTKRQLDSYFASQFKPNIQTAVYTLAGHVLAGTTSALPEAPVGMLIDGIALGVNFSRFQRFPVTYTQMELDSFLADLELALREAMLYADAGRWPARETSCDNYGGCVFREVCRHSPAQHERMLESNFKRSTWDPLRSR
jgi:hypothetical protein